jgi:hypothetical protein
MEMSTMPGPVYSEAKPYLDRPIDYLDRYPATSAVSFILWGTSIYILWWLALLFSFSPLVLHCTALKTMTTFKILVLPGDGVGPEVTAEAIKVLRAVERCTATGTTFDLTHALVGLSSEEKLGEGVRITREVLDQAVQADAVLFGSEGGPITGQKRVPGRLGALLQIRRELNLYANLRPCQFVSQSLYHLSALRLEVCKGVDIMLGA